MHVFTPYLLAWLVILVQHVSKGYATLPGIVGNHNIEPKGEMDWRLSRLGLAPRKGAFCIADGKREEVEQQLGELEWCELPHRKASALRLRRKSDPLKREDWPIQIDWMVAKLEAFNRTFRPLVKSLDASEWRPDDESEE